ncbi:hypothetical protein [Streptomyces flavofungini]|uniref:DNA primase/polymerase bifunctional N-terminal domain-containing protein n=1 Tax=Streptomyces flavofungini TaxID=68200 RepID=A0ABS0XJS0_9ACTN|nr:hypothetical protein [Streptomyces flavofungini]MBJ3813186.1 hypothetical protein [Streptomyces flavofungini]GHC90292.1 hypothetical protein GCM10010349_78530 [Streptomyces flavofungini]
MNALDRGSIVEWLTMAHPVPRQAASEWANHGIALLPLGERFDAIRVPGRLLHAALGSDQADVVEQALDDWLHGPVICDTRTGSGCYYVLVAPDAACEGCGDRLSTGTYLAVPRIGTQVSPVTYWAVPPQRRGHLCNPAHLEALLSTAETLKAIEP